MSGTLFVVATPIGNLEDISARAIRVLREASLIAAEDTRRTAHLLTRYAITTPTTSLHEHNEDKKGAALIERLKSGSSIALVSDAGTPTVSDPGARLIRAAIEAGVRVEPIPGPSAALAALAASGIAGDRFVFLGFPPTPSKDRTLWLEQLQKSNMTAVFFESPHRIRPTLADVERSIGDCHICVARELTKAHEELVIGPISEVSKAISAPRGEYTVVVDLANRPKTQPISAPSEQDLAHEFGELTYKHQMSRRAAIAALARKYSQSARDVYAAIERAKKSGD